MFAHRRVEGLTIRRVTRDDERPVDEQSWHDRQSVVLVGGAAAFVLVAIVAFAVIRVSRDATEPPQFFAPVPSATTSAPAIRTVTPTTSYTVPSVQTSQYNPPPAPRPRPPPPRPAPLPPTEIVGPDGFPTVIYPTAPGGIDNPPPR